MFIPLHDSNALRHIRLQYVTLGIIVVNCLVWLVTAMLGMGDGSEMRAAFFSYGFVPAVANGYQSLPPEFDRLPELATYVSYAFLHGDFMHLAGNMLFIWVFGDNVEDATGHFRFLVFFLLCAAAGALMHSLIQPRSTSPLVGASGAAAGVITAYVMLHPRVKVWILALGRVPLRISAMWVVGAWIAFQVVNLLIAGDSQVSWGAHVGGILAGAVLIPFFKRRNVALFDRKPVDEVIPPVPPPAVAEEGHRLPGQPPEPASEPASKQENAGERDETDSGSTRRPGRSTVMPWGRQPR